MTARRDFLWACAALAFVPGARAQTPVDAGEHYANVGPYTVTAIEETWTDTSRNRAIPVQMYVPSGIDRVPLIVFSHGLGGSRRGGDAWGRHWASHGYLSLHVQHAGSDESLLKDATADMRPRQALQRGINRDALQNRVDDVHFVLDEAQRRASAGDAQCKRVDASRIGMSGHSYGAATTQAIAGERKPALSASQDKRIRAAIAFSPAMRKGLVSANRQFAGVQIPFLSITGTKDATKIAGDVRPEDRVQPFEAMPAPNKYLLVIDGADHMALGGQEKRVKDESTRTLKAGKAATLAFWNAFLKDDAEARRFLDGDAGSAWFSQFGAFKRK